MANEKRKKDPVNTNCKVKKAKSDNSKESVKPSTSSKKSLHLKMVNIKPVPEKDIPIDSLDEVNMKIKGTNVVRNFLQIQREIFKPSIWHKVADEACVQYLKKFHIFSTIETPDLRVTCLQWHPYNPRLFVTGGKHGTVQLFKVSDDRSVQELSVLSGVGPGGTMDAIRFNTKRSGMEVCTASVDGTISTYNFETEDRKILIETENSATHWFTALDIHQDGKSVFAGDNRGFLTIHHLDSKNSPYPMGSKKLHTSKIKHVEFNSRYPYLMATASIDKSVKLWDIRKLTDELECFLHENGLSAAKFSLRDGSRLLTTDLYSELCVYKAPLWTLEHKIKHPHKHFQHLTNLKASWYPLADVFLIGRNPNPKLPEFSDMRSVDVFLASSGNLCYEMLKSEKPLTSLVEFNCSGTVLATTSGRTVNLWKVNEEILSDKK